MKPGRNKVIGIVGGMGPEAGLALFKSILLMTPATLDQEHLPVILMSFPDAIGDRTQYLDGYISVNPAYSIVKMIRKLEAAGAEVVGLACNTVYSPAIFDVISGRIQHPGSSIALLNMPFETCRHIKDNLLGVRRIGLMTTNGTYRSGIYKTVLETMGFEVVIPDARFQNDIIHRMIYDPRDGIKACPGNITNQVKQWSGQALSYFKQQQVDAIILGCTDLSLVFTESTVDEMIIVDSTASFARALIREALAENPFTGAGKQEI
ncbi:aspartate racemase [Chitinophaga ginsengisegetis]|uniref:Aspartate racemase n=1 Tax=Chitinophaga ginsengisegetis TaxID=393003 RepID=A0A1T5PD00_9BACT|nr:amino acid racemase [Chitinophaga ginsengisegetis]SKD10527.1 aspartate racemase [Chitinophaga ginsengisegetis]